MKSVDVSIVTGGSNGIGKAICIKLAENGSDVVIADIDKKSGLEVKKEIEKIGRKCLFIETDISNKEEVYKMVNKVVNEYGKINLLVNNAAIAIEKPFLDTGEELWNKTIDINLKGTYFCSQAAAKAMLDNENGGKIVNITSVQSKTVWVSALHSPYEISKAGIVMMTKQLAYELAKHNITVNAVGPGPTDTELFRNATSDEEYQKVVSRIPLNRVASTSDVANTVAFLASDDADYLTGITIYVDGGRLTW